ncbi:hypothetical protein CKO51_05265 [Rhodopirellula sp. SM50]|nr:hypothetical protein [Rhodopirellula sp. SM50]PAY20628.1 hypothetical protein CKO51_05265 [Rhodopirellula sp. SM50]
MAFTTMHFGVGMACDGAAALGVAAIRRKGFRAIGPAMTLGGIWAIPPDSPRIFSWYPSLPFSEHLNGPKNEQRLTSDLFFFHATLDAQPQEFALLGLAIILVLYNTVIFTPLLVDLAKRIAVVEELRRFGGVFGRERNG